MADLRSSPWSSLVVFALVVVVLVLVVALVLRGHVRDVGAWRRGLGLGRELDVGCAALVFVGVAGLFECQLWTRIKLLFREPSQFGSAPFARGVRPWRMHLYEEENGKKRDGGEERWGIREMGRKEMMGMGRTMAIMEPTLGMKLKMSV